MSAPLVVHITPQSAHARELIGGKAASLGALMRAGAAVPAAFVLTTEAYRRWAAGDDAELATWLLEGMQGLEQRTQRRFGVWDEDPLIVSVRSGAPVSMPGMMDTILNVGIGRLDARSPAHLCEARGRFLRQYARTVLELESSLLAQVEAGVDRASGFVAINALEDALASAARGAGKHWPSSAAEELAGTAVAVFRSWNSDRARLYRRMRRIDDALGTTVTVQQMVFGNRDTRSGSGVAFTRDPTSGRPGLSGEFVPSGQGEEVVAGTATGQSLEPWRLREPRSHAELDAIGRRLERADRQVHEIEFTVESGRLYILQCRAALLTARAAARVAVEMVSEGLIDRQSALAYAGLHGYKAIAEGERLSVRPEIVPMIRGLPVGGGVGVGRVAFTARDADELIAANARVVFIAAQTSPQLLPVMQRAAALVTMTGGATSHAAVVARSLGTPCVVGVGALIDGDCIRVGSGLRSGDLITVDGDSGAIYAGDVAERRVSSDEYAERLREWSVEADDSRSVGEVT